MANQKSDLVENQDYCGRTGAINHGHDYEIEIASLLLLRCSRQNVEDMKLMQNIEGCGAFDDIVVFVKFQNMNYAVYFIQLKHQEKAKNIEPQELRRQGKSAFGLPKYFDDFCAIQNFRNEALPSQSAVTYLLREINQNLHLRYIIFTNRGAHTCNLLKKTAVDPNFDRLINMNGNVFQFDPDQLELILRTNDTEEFSNNCFLFANQIAVGKALNQEIEKEIKNLLQPMVLTSDILYDLREKYMSVITKWSKGDLGGFYHLTKRRVLEILAEFVFNKYMTMPNANEANYENFQFNIWDDIIQKYKLTIVELDNTVDRFLQVHIQNTIDAFRKNSENQILWKENQDALNRLMLRNMNNNLAEACDKDIYEHLWKRRKLPVFLKTGEHLSFKHVLNIYEAFKDMFHIIVMHRGETESPGEEISTKSFSTLNDLDEELRQNVLESSVVLQHGRPHIKLKHCLNGNFLKFIKVRDIVHIFSCKYCIGDKLNNLPEFFVPRSINRIILQPQVLVQESNEIFAINCSVKDFRTFLDNCKMTPYLHDSQICSVSTIESEPRKLSNSKFLIVEDSKAFDKMFDSNFFVPVHFLLLLDLNIIQWLKSNGTVQNINQFALYQNSIASNTISTDTFSRKLLIPNLINASPGMGKSILMDYIALNAPKYMWVLRVSLSEHIDYYESDHFEFSYEEPFEYLLELNKRILNRQCRNTNVASMIFKQNLDHKNILVLFDGYDEVPEKYRKKVASMIKKLHDHRYSMCVTTRTIIKYELERLLDTFAVDINPFTEEERISFLKDYFTYQFDDYLIDDEKVLTFVHELLTAAHKNLSDKDEEYTGVPLQLSLLAQVFTEECKAYLLSNNLIHEDFNLQSLYQKFIEGKSKIFCRCFFNHPEANMLHWCKKLRSLLALQLLFPEEDVESLNIEEEINDMNITFSNLNHLIQKDGIVASICQSNTTFVHRTFAEYIVAEWLSENIKNRYKKTAKQLIGKIFDSNYTAIRYFFDQILAKDCPLHLAIINHQVEKATEIIRSNPASLHDTDDGNRSFLHLIASWGVQHPLVNDITEISIHFQRIVNKDKAVKILKTVSNYILSGTTRDSFFNYTAFDYAITVRSLYVANILCAKLENLNQQIFSNNISLNYNIEPHLKQFPYASLESVLIMHAIVQKLNMHNKKDMKDSMLEDVDENDTNSTDGSGRTRLHWATINGELDAVSRMLSNGCDANAVDDDNMSALHYALIVTVNNQHKIIVELLKNGARVGLQDFKGKTPLHYAVHYNQVKNLQLLLAGITKETRTNPVKESNCLQSLLEILRITDSRGCTVMHWASEKGNINIMQLLLDHGVNVDVKDQYDLTPLHWAASNGHIETIKFLLSKKADPQIKDGQLNRTPLILAAENGCSDVVELLITHKVDIEAVDIKGWSPLHWASKSGYSDTAELLISRGADVYAQDCDGLNPLHWASRQGHVAVVEKLLCLEIYEAGKTVLGKIDYIKTKDYKGLTALHWATQNKHLDVIVLLKNNGADIDAIDNEYTSALQYAVINNHKATVELLLSIGANVNIKDNENRTALHVACQLGNVNIVDMLLSNGAELELKEKTYGRTAIILAAMGGHTSTVQLMLSKGASLIVSDNNGLTSLHWAAIKGHPETVKLLQDNGAKQDARDRENLTPMDWAKKMGHKCLASILNKKLN